LHGTFESAPPKRIAIIGSGISGLSAAWLLSKRHRVTLYEKDDRLGGHTHTVDVDVGETRIPVDTGFIVYNVVNYPNLVEFLKYLDVETTSTEMSFSVSVGEGAFEYAGSDLWGLIAQKRNLLRPRFYRMVSDLRRFYSEAPTVLGEGAEHQTLGDYLREQEYGETFVNDHLIPMGAAIWSTPANKMLDYPVKSFVKFCENHGLLRLRGRPTWRTVIGGARKYVERIREELTGPVRVAREACLVTRRPDGVIVRDNSGHIEIFDDVVIAAHADQALRLLADPDPRERALLGAFAYQQNRAVLHSDPALMPRRRGAWASWNYLTPRCEGNSDGLSVTYWMNRLQPIGSSKQIFVTLNPYREPVPGTILKEVEYSHPIFDRRSEQAQKDLWSLQGRRNTWFCGAYFGWGFHEDGLQSGLAVAEDLGGLRRPWIVDNESYRIERQAIDTASEGQAA